MPPSDASGPVAEPHVFTVSELNRTVRDVLEGAFGAVWVEGELSNLARPRSGHMYFSLKDRDAQVRCAMFRARNRMLHFEPEAGMLVRARVRVGLYEPRGEYQLIVEQLEPSGAGALARAFEELKQRLSAEGLFAAEDKRPIPATPARIGIVTSATGAAIRDALHVLARRFPGIPVVLYPVAVQGDQAAPGIVRMLQTAGRRAECDVLLLIRGGGSLEDLWPFNEESVARAIRACPIPVVSGVGHEVDVTIADFAADQRAPTPSAAAELVSPDASALRRHLAALEQRLRYAAQSRLRQRRQGHEALNQRLYRQHPERRLQQLQQRRDELTLRLQRCTGHALLQREGALERAEARLRYNAPTHRIARLGDRVARAERGLRAGLLARLQSQRARLDSCARALDAVSPLATLGRGYALVTRHEDGQPLTTSAQTAAGERVDIRLARGQLGARVESIHPEESE
ncbi:MAG: exodeoxyribonuclease VII large subunit [Halofilum sp. (in: g-proteobacteria)]